MITLHLLFLAYSVICILVSDHLGLLYFLGKQSTLPVKKLTLLHRLTWIGLLGLIISGIILVLPDIDYYRSDPAFLIKMGFVGILVINGFFIGRLMHTATIVSFRKLDSKKKLLLIISGGASAISWIGATLIGFFWL